MSTLIRSYLLWLLATILSLPLIAQTPADQAISKAAKALHLREIGPALMGGRIADIAVHPDHPNTWYVAVGSGNLWKTTNRGMSWTAVFDDQPSYSIGCVTIDPNNPEIIWVGTGENVSGRHVGWGDGVYRSPDGGKSWQHMGLKTSEHIGKILVDPRDSDVIYVAAEGPLWSSGGERGLYKSEDGGKSWELSLEIDEHTGVTDIEFDPVNPDVIYAAAYQRRRKTWALMAGGPHSGIYKSTDEGESWRKIKTGLPKGDMGKIGLAVTPADPNLVYATIEANAKEKGFYRSTDKGESWEKRNSYTSGGTGPHYYQEIEASNVDPDVAYQMDVFLHVTRDGGKTFDYLETGRAKHSDNHALWIDPADGDHLIAGTDGGLYESFDEGQHFRHFPNLPISQFYKLGLDNAEPFYNIVGGAQDLGTLIGPSRTLHTEGIRNQDWYVPLGADGYASEFDPDDPNIAYMEYQQGVLHRLDRHTDELINVQPQAAPNDPPERWNWDSPLLISPHASNRLYFGSQRLWKSDDRGNSWTAISGDLTTNTNRYELAMTDRVWSVDDLYDNGAMSKYATITTIAESPKTEGLLYTGSDDGLIHISGDDGVNWRKSGALPAVPARSFINDLEASLHDANTVFAVADAHKFGDYRPLVFMSSNQGRSWSSISGDLPEGTIVWAIKQDHEDANLLFIGTEYGLYFSYNKGRNWVKLSGGVPTIPFRDLELHQREHDLVGATFGRGFYVLDDYSPLRKIRQAVAAESHTLFPVRNAWWYIPAAPMQATGMPSQGSDSYRADNPPFGAIFTYFLKGLPKSTSATRKAAEKAQRKEGVDTPFPGWETLRTEAIEGDPQVLLLIRDSEGQAVRWIKGTAANGLQRANWDLRLPAPDPVRLTKPAFQPPWAGDPEGPMAAPGRYSAQLYVEANGELTRHGEAQSFVVHPVPSAGPPTDFEAVAVFQAETRSLMREMASASRQMGEAGERLRYLDAALRRTPLADSSHFAAAQALKADLAKLRMQLSGDPARQKLDESRTPSIYGRVSNVAYGHWNTRQLPTQTFKDDLQIAQEGFAEFEKGLKAYLESFTAFEAALEKAGAPFTKGRGWK